MAASSIAQARLLELKALGLGPRATEAQIIAAINQKFGSNPPTIDTQTGLPYTQATARKAGSNQLGPQILGGAFLGGVGGGIIDAITGAGAEAGAAAEAGGAAEAGAGAGEAGAGAAAGAGGGGAAGAAGIAGGGLLAATAGSITSALDFMKFIAWIFHPRNILRAVEFVVGIGLMIFGFHAALQARGERIEGFTTSEGALTRSGLGRVATQLGNAARTGQRPSRPESAPHRTRQRALSQRYRREEDLRRRRSSQKADVSRAKAPRPKKSKTEKVATVASRLAK